MNATLRKLGSVATLCVGLATGGISQAAERDRPKASGKPAVALRAPSSFANIKDPNERSAALFVEAARVMTHPRCANCHPVTRTPAQGEDSRPHVPLVFGGPDGHGVAGMPCQNCHGDKNADTATSSVRTIPGNSHWALAPASMAWLGKSVQEICEQVKDPKRNGGRSLAKIQEHMTTDSLVGWAWHPGAGREPAPGTQEQFGQLIAAWIETGAACPSAPSRQK